MLTCPICGRRADVFVGTGGHRVTLHPCKHQVNIETLKPPAQPALPFGK